MEHKLDKENRRLADYLYKDLNPEELVEFEQELSNDPELLESYKLNKEVADYLRTKLQLEEMRSDPMLEDAEKLADLAFDMPSEGELLLESAEKSIEKSAEGMQGPVRTVKHRKSRIRNLTFTAALAASLAILLTLGLPAGLDQDVLYDRYYLPLEASDYAQRGEANDAYREIALGINNYLDGNYDASIEQFRQLAADPVFQSEVHFFTALSHMGLGQYSNAQKLFESLINSDSRYHPEALWYLSLCCLKAGEIEQASQYLGQLESYDGMYQKDAHTLRNKFRRLK